LGLCSLEAEVCLNSEFPELDEKYQKLFQASYEGADQLATELVVIHKEGQVRAQLKYKVVEEIDSRRIQILSFFQNSMDAESDMAVMKVLI